MAEPSSREGVPQVEATKASLSGIKKIAADVESNYSISGGEGQMQDHGCCREEPSTVADTSQVNQNLIIPGKLVNLVSKFSDLLEAEVEIRGTKRKAVIDSGAQFSLVSSKLVDDLGLPLNDTSSLLRVVGENSYSTLGKVDLPISINGVPTDVPEFCVFDCKSNERIELLLGCDFLTLNRIEVLVKDRVLVQNHSDGSQTRIFLDNASNVPNLMVNKVPCYAMKDITLKQGQVSKVAIKFELPRAHKSMLMYSDDHMNEALEGDVHGYQGVLNGNSKFVYMSASDGNVTIKKGSKIGTLNTVLELDTDDKEIEDCQSNNILNDVDLSHLGTSNQSKVKELLDKYVKVFSTDSKDIGLASVTSHKIRLTNDTPIYQRPRRFPLPITEELERQCEELSEADIIEPSNSPWSSPIVPVRKPDGTIRMCIDYRKLNEVTIPDKFPVPNLSDSIFGLHGTQFFTSLDLVRGYYQLPIDEDSRQYTAFSTQKNHWQFKRLSFGLRNAPAAFQREIQAVLSAFPSNKVIAYLDDILIMGTSFEEHLSLVSKVLQTLESYSIKVKLNKCAWFQSEVKFLGHIVSSSGIKKTPEYVDRVREYPRPKTVGELREFLGFVNFQRKFLPNCSSIQKPLSMLTSGKKSKPLTWTYEMIHAFDQLKREMQIEIELAYPDYSSEASKLELWVDASATGAGAYLAQQQGECHRVIGFASMTFTSTQLNYSTLERELTALRWGVKTFRPFLYGIEFVLYTDHQPLAYLNNMKIICSRLARTLEELSDFTYEIRYVPGHMNSAADALSRLNYKVPVSDAVTNSQSLPAGLVLDGLPSPGGGDSMFMSLYTVINRVNVDRLPATVDGLREQLVGDLLAHPDKYKLNLDRDSRKALRLMKSPGQLPSLDVLIAACRLYDLRVLVYFWPEQPVVYQYGSNATHVVHLQCLSGVHFNPLLEMRQFEQPDLRHCAVNSVCLAIGEHQRNDVPVAPIMSSECDEDDNQLECMSTLFINTQTCVHDITSESMVQVGVGDSSLCALLDTGAEISLISEGALKEVQTRMDIEVVRKNLCEVVGFSGKCFPITKVVHLKIAIGTYVTESRHQFAVISDDVLPCCVLIGLDFMERFHVDLDFNLNMCKQGGKVATRFLCKQKKYNRGNIMFCATDANSHIVKSRLEGDTLRFELEGNGETVNGLSWFMEDNLIEVIQSRSPELKTVIDQLNCESSNNLVDISHYKRYMKKLKVKDGILVFGDANVIVVPREILLELALNIHFHLSHIGRDKLRELLFKLCWHPDKSKIISDVCTTCHICQTMKEFTSPVAPPTLKVSSSYPFELVAADLISLPRTMNGHVGCLVVVDHYSKFVFAVAIKDKRSCTIVDALANKVFPFMPAVPTSMLTDNGPEFSSVEFSSFMERCDINHRLTTPYCPGSNGAVERVNRTIQNFLKVLVDEVHNWDQKVARAVISYNNTMHSELDMSPSRFLLTRAHSVQSDPPMNGKLRGVWKQGNPKFMPFQVGELVLLKEQLKGNLTVNKFKERYQGPYTVDKVNENGLTYELKEANCDHLVRAHHTQLRPYKLPPKYIVDNPCYKRLVSGCLDPVEECSEVIHYSFDAYVPTSDSSTSEDDSDDNSSSGSEPSSFHGFNVPVCKPRVRSKSPVKTKTSVSSIVCRGCEFERAAEDRLKRCVVSPDSSYKPVPSCSVEERSPVSSRVPANESHNIVSEVVLDWDQEPDWQMSDESAGTDRILHSSSYENDFLGFSSNPIQLNPRQEYGRLYFDDDNESDDTVTPPQNKMRTRSQGAVAHLPNVQPVVLERRRRTFSRFYQL